MRRACINPPEISKRQRVEKNYDFRILLRQGVRPCYNMQRNLRHTHHVILYLLAARFHVYGCDTCHPVVLVATIWGPKEFCYGCTVGGSRLVFLFLPIRTTRPSDYPLPRISLQSLLFFMLSEFFHDIHRYGIVCYEQPASTK